VNSGLSSHRSQPASPRPLAEQQRGGNGFPAAMPAGAGVGRHSVRPRVRVPFPAAPIDASPRAPVHGVVHEHGTDRSDGIDRRFAASAQIHGTGGPPAEIRVVMPSASCAGAAAVVSAGRTVFSGQTPRSTRSRIGRVAATLLARRIRSHMVSNFFLRRHTRSGGAGPPTNPSSERRR